MSEEKKRRFAVGRKGGVNFYLDFHQVFYDIERATTFAKVRNENAWSVFELHDMQTTGLKETGIMLPYAITCEARRNSATEEIIYDTRGNGRAAINARVRQSDSIFYMTVIDYAGKEEEKEDFVMTFFRDASGWRSGCLQPAETKTGWVCDEYRVKVQLPKIREVPSAN